MRPLTGRTLRRGLQLLIVIVVGSWVSTPVLAQENADIVSRLVSGKPEDLTISLKILGLLTVLTIAPSILLLTTAFPRIVIVLGFVRRALSTQETPPNQVIIGLALILTFMVMAPTFANIQQKALNPYLDEKISDEQAYTLAVQELRDFMYPQIALSDLELMVEIAHPELLEGQADGLAAHQGIRSLKPDDIPLFTVIPAFVLSELKRAFEMGFLIYLPFVVIDMVVASTLISMGMLVLPPVMISLPFKILVFVLVDGWSLVVEQVVRSFG